MIYIENNCNDPSYNLAFEEYVFRELHIDEPVLLLWQNGPSVIIGKYQNAIEEVDIEYLREHDVSLVRRSTGGGAVYHDLGNLNFSFIVPRAGNVSDYFGTGGEGSSDDPVGKAFSVPVIKALASLGIRAERSGRNDLLAGGCKFSGCAEQRSAERILHHGTLMFDVDMDAVAAALRVKPGKFRSKSVKSVRSRVTNLKPLLDEAACSTVLEFRDLLFNWFRREYDVKDVFLTGDQLEAVRRICDEKYGNDDWNLGRSPAAEITRGDFFPCGQIEFNFSVKNNIISEMTITGDFFSRSEATDDSVALAGTASDSVEKLEAALNGIPYEKEALLSVLRQHDLNKIFGKISPEELVATIL